MSLGVDRHAAQPIRLREHFASKANWQAKATMKDIMGGARIYGSAAECGNPW